MIAESNFSGYLKSYTVVQEEISSDVLNTDRLYQNQLSSRLMLDYFKDNQIWQIHYELGRDFNSNRPPFSASDISGEGYRYSDIRNIIGPNDGKNQTIQNLDRFNVQFQFDAGDLTIGRQAITFGAARIINPTDVFLPFDVQALNTEYRTGIDGIRFQRPFGQVGELDFGIILGPDGDRDNSAVFAQLQTNISGGDYQFTLISFSEQQLAAFGLQSALGEFGLWFETAFVTGDVDYNRSSIGIDYGFNENWFGTIEYHYNGAGSQDTNDYLTELVSRPYQDGGVFLLGKHYLIPVISWQASALLGMSFQAIANLDDGSIFINANADYSLSDNLYLGLGYYLFSGDNLTLQNGNINLDSEYGGNPNRFILSLRYYF